MADLCCHVIFFHKGKFIFLKYTQYSASLDTHKVQIVKKYLLNLLQ
jgi:hypothetical protein